MKGSGIMQTEKLSSFSCPEFKELAFDEAKHQYRLNGNIIPSVTTVMQPLSKDYYGAIDENILASAAKRGTAVHNAIENFLDYGISDIPAQYAGYYNAFVLWLKENGVKAVATESRVYHKILRYAGTIDMACVIGGKYICVDFKTSAEIVKMLTAVQLEAYARAYESHGVKFDGKAIVHLRKDGTYKMDLDYPMRDLEAWEVFGSCLTISNYLRKRRK